MVQVLSQNGDLLAPTKNHAKVRLMLRENRAYVINKEPFAIQLNYEPKAPKKESS